MAFTIRNYIPEDIPLIVSMINSQEVEGTSVEEMERGEKLRPADMPFRRLCAFDTSGALVAYGVSFQDPGMPEGCYGLRIRVDKAFRHQGAGRQLYAALEDWAFTRGATRLETNVKDNDPEAMAWAERRGWAKEHHLFESTLQLAGWVPAPELVETVRRGEAEGIRFTNLGAEVAPEQAIRRLYDLLTVMIKDVPVFGERPLPPFDVWKGYVTGSGKFDPRNTILAVDGENWAAMCLLDTMESGGMYHGLTAVDRAYRGRGLSTAVKVVALEYARDKGVPYVRTNNHSANERMLAVNRKFGYVPAPGFHTIAKTVKPS